MSFNLIILFSSPLWFSGAEAIYSINATAGVLWQLSRQPAMTHHLYFLISRRTIAAAATRSRLLTLGGWYSQ